MDVLDILAQLGVLTIDQLLLLERVAVAERFAGQLLVRLDQAFGTTPEVIVPHRPPPEYRAVVELDFPTDRREEVDQAGQRGRLARAGGPGDQHEPARQPGHVGDPRRDAELLQRLDLLGDQPEGGADGVALEVDVEPEAGLAGQGEWQITQMFLHGVSFGVQDPQFHRDVGFYAFDLPFYRYVLNWLFAAVAIGFIVALVTHYLFGGIRLTGRSAQVSTAARTQLAPALREFFPAPSRPVTPAAFAAPRPRRPVGSTR